MRPHPLAASFISSQACDVGYWHIASIRCTQNSIAIGDIADKRICLPEGWNKRTALVLGFNNIRKMEWRGRFGRIHSALPHGVARGRRGFDRMAPRGSLRTPNEAAWLIHTKMPTKHQSATTMSLGNIRANGVRTLAAWCLGRGCNQRY
jgi:hypothetical protein